MTYIEQRVEALEALVSRLQERIEELESEVYPERRVEGAPELISMAEAARLAGKHRNTVYGWVRDGKLEIVERVGREALVSRDALLEIIEADQ